MTSPSARIALHLLAGAGRPLPIAELMAGIGIRASSVQATVSTARQMLEGTGAKIIPTGSLATLAYHVEGIDLATVEALIGLRPECEFYQGFRRGTGRVLKALQDAAGQPVFIRDLSRAMSGKTSPAEMQRTRDAVQRIRTVVAEEGWSSTAVAVGPDAFAWRAESLRAQPAAEPGETNDEPVITLPSVGGAYHYTAGRLYLEGRALPVRIGA